MRRMLVVAAAYLLFVPLSFADGHSLNKHSLQQALEKARVDNKVSAMQMTVVLHDRQSTTFAAGRTEKKGGNVVTPDTLFQIGSETKSFTAALLLKLASEKKLKLTDTVGQYFPQYEQWKDITISQLLHNNSGIYNYSEDKSFQKQIDRKPDYQWTSDELLAIAAKHPDDFKPGEGWHYSNSNFILAGLIAEKVTKQTLAHLYRSYFIGPTALNLTHTYYLPMRYAPVFMKNMAHGYDENGKDITSINMSWAGAAGAMVSNSSNLADWAYDLFHAKALSEAELKQMMQLVSTKSGLPVDTSTQEGYGLGVGMRTSERDGKWWGHEGETLGYHAIFIWFPKYDLTVSAIANGEAPDLRHFALQLPAIIGLK